MLLKALYDLAGERSLLKDIHLQKRKVHVLIPLTEGGDLAAQGVLTLNSEDRSGKSVLGRQLLMPRFPGENNGGKAYFLAESCTYVLGFETPSGQGIALRDTGRSNPAKSFLHFWEQIESAYEKTGLPELNALLLFRRRFLTVDDGRAAHALPFIELREIEKNKKKQIAVGALTVTGDWVPLEKLTLSFQVDGNLVFKPDPDDALNRYWQETFRELAFSCEEVDDRDPGARGLCLVSESEDATIARSHKPKILGIPGLASGGYIVSFARESPAFSSFGFDMGENAPISEEAAAAYALGLQSLLDDENRALRIGPAVVCFWARKDERQAGLMASLLRKADPKAVADFLKSPWTGMDRELAGKDQFYSVTLSGNAGRVVVRHWMQITVAQAREGLRKWFSDLEIVQPWAEAEGPLQRRGRKAAPSSEKSDSEAMPPLALFRLACSTVREAKDLRGDVVSQLYRAALEGRTPSGLLLKRTLQEFRSALVSDSPTKPRFPFNPSRFALLKLVLNRNRKENEPMIEPRVFETHDQAYNCGRLLAVLAQAQERAHQFALEGPGIAERYFGTASAAPAMVFPLLLRLNRHHLEKISKTGNVSFIERRIQDIIVLFTSSNPGQPPEFPRHLDLQAQGRFAIGFYQERAAIMSRKPEKNALEQQPESTKEA